jgi:hypothetical protein
MTSGSPKELSADLLFNFRSPPMRQNGKTVYIQARDNWNHSNPATRQREFAKHLNPPFCAAGSRKPFASCRADLERRLRSSEVKLCSDSNPFVEFFTGATPSLSVNETESYLGRYNSMVASCGLGRKTSIKNPNCEPNGKTRTPESCNEETSHSDGGGDNHTTPDPTPTPTPTPPQEPGTDRPGTYQ